MSNMFIEESNVCILLVFVLVNILLMQIKNRFGQTIWLVLYV